jgi:FmdE, Molybdenum formylmethanofuran dehydrogenase operon
LGLEDPEGADRKRIVTFVEIDRCATDAVMVVTGCRLGKRALKFRDWGKMAATFVDVETGKAVRVVARESSKELARTLHPEIADKNKQQMLAYRELTSSCSKPSGSTWSCRPRSFPDTKGSAWFANAAVRGSISGGKCVAGARFCAARVLGNGITNPSFRGAEFPRRSSESPHVDGVD